MSELKDDGETTVEDWLEKCVPFTGFEKDLPVGVIGLPNGIDILDLVKSVVVFDDNTEDGLGEVKVADLKKGMKLASANLWEKRVAAVGSNIRIVDADGGTQLTRFPVEGSNMGSWFESIGVNGLPRHTDGLAMWAINRLRMKINGGGVHF